MSVLSLRQVVILGHLCPFSTKGGDGNPESFLIHIFKFAKLQILICLEEKI